MDESTVGESSASRSPGSSEPLELLSAAGVAMAGSFDIRDILDVTHETASVLVGRAPVEVLYTGRASIHSRALWYPPAPAEGNFPEAARARLRERLCLAAENDGGAEAVLEEELRTGGRSAFPLRYQEELLGVLFVAGSEPMSAERARLISILAQHTSTALRNIHLTQERLHFERLSTMGRMIGTIVHDLKSPLTALRGYAGMLATLELEDAERREYGRWILDECDRLCHMVSELLEFTRGGRPDLVFEWTTLSDFLGSFGARLGRHYGERGIRVELSTGFSSEVRIDSSRLERALWNVATNSCQAMPAGGTVRLSSEARSDRVVIAVEDEGGGIPEEIRHRVFEPFFSYGKSEGVGLGMATARKIAEEHGGRIEIESRDRRGTIVRFVLPVAGPGEAPAAELASAPSSVRRS
jgi:signal transduction histidine kinase